MKAIALTGYGSPEVLALHDMPDPVVGPDSVLIEVRAAGINPVDWKIREGYLQGLFPHHTPLIPGWDVAGVVAAVGPAATGFAPGDEVYAYIRKDTVELGGYAELVAVLDSAVAHKPAAFSFVEAGGAPLAGLSALQSLRSVGVGPGDTVLIHAAAGGVGHLAVQIAKALGAEVTGVCSTRNVELVQSIGADHVIDYTTADFAGPGSGTTWWWTRSAIAAWPTCATPSLA
jgi:NADPH:quinone reductase-like Zn-dependent oxidoreductase